MLLVHRQAMSLLGMGKRLSAGGELSPKVESIKSLHQTYLKRVKVDFSQGDRMYGVYHDYDTEHKSGYSVFVGASSSRDQQGQALQKLHIPAGNYLTFSGKGTMPHVVVAVWQKVWDYFNQKDCRYERNFSVDFEYYTSPNTVVIYISVKLKTS
ncbi:GyrI-like domain-containing protein [Marinomonas epiphytica]